MQHHTLTDEVVRFLILLFCLFSTCMSVATLYVYQARHLVERKYKIVDGYGMRATTYYILTAARLILIGTWAVDVYYRLGTPLTWRAIVVLPGMIAYSIALTRLFAMHYDIFMKRKAEIALARHNSSGAPDK